MCPASPSDHSFVIRWIRATWLGWIVGVPLIVGLSLLGEAVGVGGAQFIVGAGIGAGVGLFQARALRGVLARPARWFWASILRATAPFLVMDLAKLAGVAGDYSLYVAVALAGIVIGVAQSRVIGLHAGGALPWVVVSAVGWTLTGGVAALADSLFQSRRLTGIPGALAYLGIILAGGLVLGVITGPALVRTSRPHGDASPG